MKTLSPTIYYNEGAASWRSPKSTDFQEIQEFHHQLPDFSVTPLVPCASLAQKLGLGALYIKDESSRMKLPAFKILGASWATYKLIAQKCNLEVTSTLSQLQSAVQHLPFDITLVSATDGNHGRAVARMAKIVGSRATIFVPRYLDSETKDLIAKEGAEVQSITGDYDEAVQAARQYADVEESRLFIQDTALEEYEEVPQWIVDGYSTMLMEADQQLSEAKEDKADFVVVPVGVGSLAMAVVSHYKQVYRSAKVVAVEPNEAACLFAALTIETAQPIKTGHTIMDGMNCGTVSPIAWPLLKEGVDACVTISDDEAHDALLQLNAHGMVVGPCGSAPFAALKSIIAQDKATALEITPRSVVLLLCTEGPRRYILK